MNEKTIFKSFFILIFCVIISISSTLAAFNLSNIITFDEGYTPLFADFNIKVSDNGRAARLTLNRYAGSGFISSKYYDYGFFSAKIKLPGDYTAGIVVAFYMSNADVWEKNHDELDIEFLGNLKGKPWRFQTNMYGNGTKGREERYTLWFDPTKNFHRYSILWTPSKIIFYVDEVPIREIVRKETMGGDYPSKPMALYATIWDASSWATSGGRYKVKYEFQPFVTEFTDFILDGRPVGPIEPVVVGSTASLVGPTEPIVGPTGSSDCPVDPIEPVVGYTASSVEGRPVDPTEPVVGPTASSVDPTEPMVGSTASSVKECQLNENKLIENNKDYFNITQEGRENMKSFREKYMYYSYCYDIVRYPVPPPECVIVPSERDRFKVTGRLRFGSTPRRPRKKGKRTGRTGGAGNQRKNNVVGVDQQAASM